MASGHLTKALAKAKRLVHLLQNQEVPVLKESLRKDPNLFLLSQVENVFVCLRNGITQPWNDWSLQIKESSLGSEAGRGLFVSGKAVAGRVVAMYPGEVWTAPAIDCALAQMRDGNGDLDSQRIAEKMEQLISFNYTFGREDGSLIDATPCERLHQVVRSNPLALGYLINHPPKGVAPNVMGVDMVVSVSDRLKLRKAEGHSSVDLDSDTDTDSEWQSPWHASEQLPYIPTWQPQSGLPPDDSGTLTVLVAMRDIVDEELFLDYDLGEANDSVDAVQRQLPEWYESVPYTAFWDEPFSEEDLATFSDDSTHST